MEKKPISYNFYLWENVFIEISYNFLYVWNCMELYEKKFPIYENYLISIFGHPGCSQFLCLFFAYFSVGIFFYCLLFTFLLFTVYFLTAYCFFSYCLVFTAGTAGADLGWGWRNCRSSPSPPPPLRVSIPCRPKESPLFANL